MFGDKKENKYPKYVVAGGNKRPCGNRRINTVFIEQQRNKSSDKWSHDNDNNKGNGNGSENVDLVTKESPEKKNQTSQDQSIDNTEPYFFE